MPFLRPIWTFFGTRAPGIEVMVTLRAPDQARCRLACRSCRTRGRKERAPIISHVCAKPGVHALSISTPTTTDTNISLFATSEEYHSRGLCTSYVLPRTACPPSRRSPPVFFGSSHKCVHDSAPAGRPRRGKRVRMRSCQLTSGEVVCRSVDGRLRGPRF